MSSPYVKLGNRSLDQWKVAELKEELKRRRLPIKGLKEDLIKRLDEAVRFEMENSVDEAHDGSNNTERKELRPDQATLGVSVLESQTAEDLKDTVDNTFEKVDGDTAEDIDGDSGSLQKGNTVDGSLVHEADATQLVGESGSGLKDIEIHNEAMEMKVKTVKDGSKSEKPDSNDQPMKYQVSAVDLDLGIQVKSDSVSTESVSILEKNELMLDINSDNVKLESDVKHEMFQQSVSGAVSVGSESHPMDVEKPLDREDFEDSFEKKVDSVGDLSSGNLGPQEKLSLEGNSGDDSMGEDILDNKVYSKANSNEIEGNVEKSGLPKQEDDVDIVGHDKPVYFKGPDTEEPVTAHAKRKFDDQEGTGSDTLKRPRRLNVEGSKASEPQIGNSVPYTTPKATGLSIPTFKRVPVIDPAVNDEAAKERHVPPPAKPPTNSLRIDQFLRPFTLKAVQELLGKTGTVTDFWMDQIKTHCYVSYSSVEEAIETRNAVYNLQWPTNGGRLLIAEFVDPQEVRSRLEVQPSTPLSATPTSSTPQSSQPSLRQQVPKHHLPPPPAPPQLSEPPLARERPPHVKARLAVAPPPPPPVAEKFDPPIVTLDDLFRKTKATPRIYYLPLSDEEVAAKRESRGKNAN